MIPIIILSKRINNYSLKYNKTLLQMINQQKTHFLAYDALGNNKIVVDVKQNQQKFCGYIKFLDHRKQQYRNNEIFTDSTFFKELKSVQSINFGSKVIIKRLSRLYPKKYRPPLFPNTQNSTILKTQSKNIPLFRAQMQLFNVSFFKKLFLTQQITDNGKYQILVNKNGRFQVELVDDLVPVYQASDESIWGLNTQEPWQLIITKIWAKHLGGYQNIEKTSPFDFLAYFSLPGWKYYNLSLQGQNFISFYADQKGNDSKIIFKSKNANEMHELGLTPNLLGYQLLEILYEPKFSKKAIIIIKSIQPHSWTGKLSIFDKQFQTLFESFKKRHNFSMLNTLVLTQKHFLNIFSSAFITTQNMYPAYTNYHQFRLQSNRKSAIFFEFEIKKQGYLIISINQPSQNRLFIPNQNSKSQLKEDRKVDQANIKERYLQLKYMLSRSVVSGYDKQQEEYSPISSLIKLRKSKFRQRYNQLRYYSIQMVYNKGYNSGDAHFLKIIPGTYILRIRAQSVPRPSSFTISVTTHEFCQISQLNMTKQQSRTFIKHSLIAISDTVPYKNIISDKYQKLSYGNIFKAIGYGFVALKVKKQSPYSYVLEIDPQRLKKEGYSLKNEHRHHTKSFSLSAQAGQSVIIVLKRLNDGREENQYIWPTESISIFSKKA